MGQPLTGRLSEAHESCLLARAASYGCSLTHTHREGEESGMAFQSDVVPTVCWAQEGEQTDKLPEAQSESW